MEEYLSTDGAYCLCSSNNVRTLFIACNNLILFSELNINFVCTK